jgi:hypothetical protein
LHTLNLNVIKCVRGLLNVWNCLFEQLFELIYHHKTNIERPCSAQLQLFIKSPFPFTMYMVRRFPPLL